MYTFLSIPIEKVNSYVNSPIYFNKKKKKRYPFVDSFDILSNDQRENIFEWMIQADVNIYRFQLILNN